MNPIMIRLKLIFAAFLLAPFAALQAAELVIVRDAQPIAAVVLGGEFASRPSR